jgi:hypothetical protein
MRSTTLRNKACAATLCHISSQKQKCNARPEPVSEVQAGSSLKISSAAAVTQSANLSKGASFMLHDLFVVRSAKAVHVMGQGSED